MTKCPICESSLHVENLQNDNYYISCLRCGDFFVKRTVRRMLERNTFKLSDMQMANISGWIRENQGSDIILTSEKIKSLMTLKTLSVSEKADKILKYLAKHFPVAGTSLNHSFDKVGNVIRKIKLKDLRDKRFNDDIFNVLPLLSIGRIVNYTEYNFIWKEYLIKTKKYISTEQPRIITSVGWAYLESLRQPNPDSKKAFVAMWFTDEMKEICEKYIKPAAEDAGGYKAEPINDKDYNGDINDEIIGEIRNSKFVIADFTGNRGGVYYEAGFAYGIKIPVIYTCEENWFNRFVKQSIKIKDSKGTEQDEKLDIFSQIHFDVNHLNFIVWKDGKDLYEQLLKRIKATIT